MSRGEEVGRPLPPGTTTGVPPRDATHACNRGGHRHPGFSGAGSLLPLDGGHYTLLWDPCRLEDLERDLEDAQATCQALSSEQDHRLQELHRVRGDLHRSEEDLSAMRRDHTIGNW